MSKQYRASAEVDALIANLQGQADAIKVKWDAADPIPEDVATFNDLVSQLEKLSGEKAVVDAQARLSAVNERMEAPTTPAPKFAPLPAQCKKPVSFGEAMHAALCNGFSRDGEQLLNSEQQYRMSKNGIGLSSIKIPMDFSLLNSKKRKHHRTVSRGAQPGADLIFSEYSQNVIEIMAYQSPLLSLLNVENVSNSNTASYFTVDDSANASTDITASAGTELSPTIPDADMSDDVKLCAMFEITSGYQKFTRRSLTDSFVSLEQSAARWSATRHALKMEDDALGATGNGSTGRMGLLQGISSASAITGGHWTMTKVENFVLSLDIRYRKNMILVVSPDTYADMRSDLVDGNSRSYFDTNAIDDQEYDTLLGKKVVVSSYMDDDAILAFDPQFFVFRVLGTSTFDVLKEKFYPHLAGCSIADFGCVWNGPTAGRKKILLTS